MAEPLQTEAPSNVPNGINAQHVSEKTETKAIVAPKAPLSFMPSSWDDAVRISKYLAQTGLTPDALRGKEWDLLYIIATGQEFGLSPIQAVREIVIIKGKPYLSALLRIGMVKNSTVCEYFRLVESDATKAVFETKRRGEGVTKLTYTIEQARQAGVVGRKDDKGNLIPDQWNKDPALMLRRRCGSQLADEVYSDVTRGSRDREEVEEQAEREINPAPFRHFAATSAPPLPVDAELAPKASPPKNEKTPPLEVIKTEEAQTPGAFDEVCKALLECKAQADVDALSMNTDHGKLTATERTVLGKMLKERREALAPRGKR